MSGAKRFIATIDPPAGDATAAGAAKGHRMRLQDLQITVAGAGIAGLATAVALGHAGARVRVLEQAPEITEVGAGLQISPNGAAVLRALGLAPALGQIALKADTVELRDGLEDTLVARLDLGARGARMTAQLVHRADLIAILLQAARAVGADIQTGATVAEVMLLPDAGPCLKLADGTEERPDLLIGADGLHARTRQAVAGQAEPFFTGQIAWRALIPADPAEARCVEVHMGPGRHVVSYPLRGGRLRNIVAVEARNRWVQESWSLRDDPMELRLAFEDFSPRLRGWLEAVESPWLWGLFRHEVARRWVWTAPTSGRAAVILGDAAHPTLPFLAQGANMALEDAFALMRELTRADSLAAGLAAFEAARRTRCARIVAASTGAADVYHLKGPLRDLAHFGMRAAARVAPGAILSRYDWIHRHDVTQAT